MKTRPRLRTISVFEDTNFIPTQGEPKLLMIQPILNFNVPFIPTQLSFCIMTAISHFSSGEQYQIDVKLKNSVSGQEITSTKWEISDMGDGRNIPLGGVMVTNIKNMIVENEGDYIIEVYADEEKIGEEFFSVYKA